MLDLCRCVSSVVGSISQPFGLLDLCGVGMNLGRAEQTQLMWCLLKAALFSNLTLAWLRLDGSALTQVHCGMPMLP